jgi:putative pyruvate formate lyase activating enzyme
MATLIPQDVLAPLDDLLDCTCCPRNCHAKRDTDKLGFCQTGMGFDVGAIVAHRGEEPVISGPKGICNVFFTHCNMQCLFCQNYQISRNSRNDPKYQLGLPQVIERIESVLDTGVQSVGFISPSHCIPQMKVIIRALESRGLRPIYVMNTNAYDKKEAIQALEGLIDVYLPDLKYMDNDLARRFSQTPDYPEVAAMAIKEMYRQKGSNIILDDDGVAESGLIIRHLILPGQIKNSKKCLRLIAEELSTSVHVSLMAQYYPTPALANHPELGRCLRQEEYDEVREEFHKLGFYRGWVQELESQSYYRPDFARLEAFD